MRESECLGIHLGEGDGHIVVDQLGSSAAADRTTVVNRVAHRIHQWLQAREVGGAGTDHEERFAAIGMLGQAADRCIHHRQAMGHGGRGKPVGGERVDGAHVHQHGALGRVGEYAVRA